MKKGRVNLGLFYVSFALLGCTEVLGEANVKSIVILPAMAGLLLLGGCAPNLAKTELPQLCQSEMPFRQPLTRDKPVEDSADAKVAEHFGAACWRLAKLNGLEFAGTDRTYLCVMSVSRDPNTKTAIEADRIQQQAFGRRFRMEDFDTRAGEPDDVRDRMLARPQSGSRSRLPLGVSAGFHGLTGRFLLLTDKDGTFIRALYTYDDFDRAGPNVTSLSGAMTLLELKNQTGFGGARNEQCKISSITPEAAGWRVEGLPVQRNCAKSVVRDVRIGRDGSVEQIRQYEPSTLFGSVSMMCAD